ncbi:aquaporin AQPAe.a isoform X2 [Diabrotica virgifera virgifera]|uniref:Aquaporin AQPAe.a isoform X1 n=1 Tax=Diabrotica virgifera virgifera TaxID=50390 RepID=A0A6P7F4Y8_DIAVI|nr:aquaporin AQPAe.a isoform X2 [Diabrotica virgifera virgifera]
MSNRTPMIVPTRRHELPDESDDGILGVSEFTKNKNIWKALLAECLGTFLLVFIGCGSCINMIEGDGGAIIKISFAFGLTIATVVQAIAHVSGGHINPAVTFSFVCTGDVKIVKGLCYLVVQCIGAIGGSGLLKLVVPDSKVGAFGLTDTHDSLSDVQGMVMEAALTFMFLLVIQGVCDAYRKDLKGSGPLAIGLAAVACHLTGIPYTGSSINPARSFGPAVIMNHWHHHWIYWVGPLLGGGLAGVIYKILFKVRKDESYDL